jgi:hypothetical protein
MNATDSLASDKAKSVARVVLLLHSLVVLFATALLLYFPMAVGVALALTALDFPVSLVLLCVWPFVAMGLIDISASTGFSFVNLSLGLFFLVGGGWWYYSLTHWFMSRRLRRRQAVP